MSEAPARPWPHIVLIDDDEAVLAALTFAFEIDGFEVQAFASAAPMVGCDVSGAACLVVDLRLPGRDGLALIADLRGRGVRTPAVLITSQPRRADLARAAHLRVPVVEKPLLSDELVDTVRRTIAEAAHDAQV